MNRCRGIRPFIVRSVDGDLEPGEALRLARHLATCTACRIVLARESRLAEILDGADDGPGVDEHFFGAVMASLPDRPLRPGASISRRGRWRRGLRLASWGAVAAFGTGLAARVLMSLRLDMSTPAMPRFTPDETDGLISLIGSAAQWIRMTAQSVSWVGSSGAWGLWTIAAVSLSAAIVGLAALLMVSGAVAWATRTGSRAS
jgi:hypothetical protein